MKMVKSLLLGSAAGVVAVAGAQAADLPVKAKPVQYVKICTLYGDGFYYIPGSDTCIRFSGYIRADYGYNVTGARTAQYSGAAGARDRTVSNYSTRHRGSFSVDTRTQTAYGTLRTFSTFHLQNENTTESTNLSRGFIQWGGFTFGRTVSFTDHEGSMGDSGMRSLHQTQNQSDTGANGTNQIAYTWQLGNGVTLNIGADERRVKSIADLSRAGYGVGGHRAGLGSCRQQPPQSLGVVARQPGLGPCERRGHRQPQRSGLLHGSVRWHLCAGGNTATTYCGTPGDDWGWAVISGTEIKLDFLSPGSRFGAYFNYGVGATAYSGGSNLVSPGLYGSGNQIAFGVMSDGVYVNGQGIQQTTAWTVGAGFEYFWTRNFSSTIYGNYTEVSYNSTVVDGRWFCGGGGAVAQPLSTAAATCDPGFKFWTVGTHHDWFPLPGLRFAVDVMYTGIESAMDGQTVSIATKQGNRPSGVYSAKNLGITSVIFRAQRSWGAN